MAATFAASLSPSPVPFEMASKTLLPIRSLEISMVSSISSVCGYNIFVITTAPGAAIIDAASRCLAKISLCTGSSPPRKLI